MTKKTTIQIQLCCEPDGTPSIKITNRETGELITTIPYTDDMALNTIIQGYKKMINCEVEVIS
jgi:hypothetical protein